MSDPSFRLRDQLAVGFTFLTRLPAPRPAVWPDGALAQAAWSFPVVGMAVGAVAALAAGLTQRWDLPVPVAALLAVLAGVAVTGALHEDGLADLADGLGGATPERRLEIMKDSRIGAYGVLALIFSVGLRATALAGVMANGAHVTATLIAAHAVSRAGLPAIMHLLPAARPGGLGATAGTPTRQAAQAAAGLGAVIALVMLGGRPGAMAVVLAGLAGWAVAALARRRIGGYTGDVLGAAQQAAETLVLLAAAGF